MGSVISTWLGSLWQDTDDTDGHDGTDGHDCIDGQDEPDVFYECSSAGYLDVSDVTLVEGGDTYFEDSLDPRLESLDLIVDNLYHHLQGPDAPTGVSQAAEAAPGIGNNSMSIT